MSRVKYKYNTKTLSYEKIELRGWQRFKVVLSYALVSMLFVAISLVAAYTFIDSPKEKQLNRELTNLRTQYKNFEDQLGVVDKVLKDIQQRDDNIYRVIFEADPIPLSIRNAGFGGVNRYKNLEGYENSDIVKEVAKKLDVIEKQLYVQSLSLDEVFEMATNKANMLSCIPAIQPVNNKDLNRMASGFGNRIHPIYKTVKFHTGMDFSAPRGTEIFATGNGKVKEVNRHRKGYGKHIVVDHGYGFKTLYAHLDKINVHKGQNIKRGELIGYIGSTGTSTSPHLHYEIIKEGRKINPVHYFYNDLSPDEYEKMLEISSSYNQSFD